MNFIGLLWALDRTTKTREKRALLVEFLTTGDAQEVAYGCTHLLGQQSVTGQRRLLRETAVSHLGDETLFEAAYAAVGDLAETLSLLINDPEAVLDRTTPVIDDWLSDIAAIQSAPSPPEALRHRLSQGPAFANWVFLKLWTGGWRLGVSQGLITNALATVTGQPQSVIAERLMEAGSPDRSWLSRMKTPVSADEQQRSAVPFCLAHGWRPELADTSSPEEFIIEYKWDGIRCQLIRAQGVTRLWSRGDQEITAQFPDVVEASQHLPDHCLLDGELLVMDSGRPAPFQSLQTRLNRRRVSRNLLNSHPVEFRAYDLLRLAGNDYRETPLHARRALLFTLPVAHSETLVLTSWEAVDAARAMAATVGAEGLMLKSRDSLYYSGRKQGVWWKWKRDPMTADVVLLYAQAGHGRRARLHTDYTFGVRTDNGEWLTVAKAYSGLTDTELKHIDRWIRQHTIASFGPVRQVTPTLVFEIAFEGIARSTRHKSGIALRFPRILRQRLDLSIDDADGLSQFETLLDDSQ
ncbi:MAG: ATP-dependent DNA ligase [Litorivicinaceae bacterium]